MKFFKLPSWIVWILVSLAVLLLCTFWQWRHAMNLLDKTADELEQERERRKDAEAAKKAADESAARERELAVKRAKIVEETMNELKKIEEERKLEAEKIKAIHQATRKEVAIKGTAADKFNEWKSKKR
jgi:biopolymer transport protein ExbB/TolQ